MLNSLKTLLMLHSLTAGCIIRTCLASTCDLESQSSTKTIKTKNKKCWGIHLLIIFHLVAMKCPS